MFKMSYHGTPSLGRATHLSTLDGVSEENHRGDDGESHHGSGAQHLGVDFGGVDDVFVVEDHVVGGEEHLNVF